MREIDVVEVNYGKIKADKPGVSYPKKWRVQAYVGDNNGKQAVRGKNLLNHFDKKKRAVKEARRIAKNSRGRPVSMLKVKTKSGKLSKKTRYD